MPELLALAQAPDTPQPAATEPEPRREPGSGSADSATAGHQQGSGDSLQHTMGNSAVQRLAAGSPQVSRPADPGEGPGLDVVFVFSSSQKDPAEQQEYIRDMTNFVRSALPGERLYKVADLDELLALLFVMGANGESVRRLRIVGHGSHDRPGEARYTHGGRVLTHDPGGRPVWIGADVVTAAARDPDNIRLMREVMTPDAVVEFWGCSLGGYEKSARAWSGLFQRRFVATSEHLRIDPWRYWILLGPADSRHRKPGEEIVTDEARHRWLAKRAETSAEVDEHGAQASSRFDEFLFARYQSLVADGQIPPVAGDRNAIVSHMRRMFDAQLGAVHELAIPTSSGPVGPGQPARWNRLWRVLEPRPVGVPGHGPDKRPASPQPGLPGGGASRAVKRPQAVLSERAWTDRHPAGRTEQSGEDTWVLWNFDVGSSSLKREHTSQLDAIAAKVAASAAAVPLGLSVDGFASASGSADFNQHLSAFRADHVAAYLRRRLGPAAVIVASGRGTRGSLARGTPDDLAGNRRVEVRITGRVRSEPPVREPLPPPDLDQPFAWQSVGSADDKHGKVLADYLPGYSIEGKWSSELPSIPLGTDWLLVGELELGLKLEFKSKVPVNVANSFKDGKWNSQLKAQFGKAATLSANPKEGKVSVRFDGVPLKPEVETGIGDLLSDPASIKEKVAKDPKKLFKVVSVKFTMPVKPLPEVDLGRRIPELAGFRVELSLQPKVIVSLVPSPAMLLRMAAWLGPRLGAAGGPIAAGVIGGAAYTVLALYLIDQAHKRGERWADVVNFRRAYARRLAAEATDWRAGRGITSNRGWDEARTEMLKARQHRGVPGAPDEAKKEAIFERTYAREYEGWKSAEAALQLLSAEQYDATMEMLRKRYGSTYKSLEEGIFASIGGASKDPIAFPADLAEFR